MSSGQGKVLPKSLFFKYGNIFPIAMFPYLKFSKFGNTFCQHSHRSTVSKFRKPLKWKHFFIIDVSIFEIHQNRKHTSCSLNRFLLFPIFYFIKFGTSRSKKMFPFSYFLKIGNTLRAVSGHPAAVECFRFFILLYLGPFTSKKCFLFSIS